MKQIFLASSFFQAATIAAAIDAGHYDRAVTPSVVLEGGGQPDELFQPPTERILLASTAAVVLENAVRLSEVPELGPVLSRFDRVLELTDFISPLHPQGFAPKETELPIWERTLRDALEIGSEDVELILESPQANPARALARIFHDAPLRVHSDGLMTFSPTRSSLPIALGQRMTSLHFVPLVEGIQPRLLSEFGITPIPIDLPSFQRVIDEVVKASDIQLPAELATIDPNKTAVAFGQYLSALNLVTAEEENELHQRFVTAASKAGMSTLVFKPHPASPPEWTESLKRHADRQGVNLIIYSSPVIAEALVALLHPALVIGCFSTALATSRAVFNVPAQAIGTELLLERITPYENSNRIPLTIADAIFNGSAQEFTDREVSELQRLVDSVSYAMQPTIVPQLRPVAVDFLNGKAGTPVMKYFKKRRLTALDLPGRLPKRNRPKTVLRKSLSAGKSMMKETIREFRKQRKLQKEASAD